MFYDPLPWEYMDLKQVGPLETSAWTRPQMAHIPIMWVGIKDARYRYTPWKRKMKYILSLSNM